MRQVLSRQVLGKGMLTAAAVSSLLSIATGAASAHSGATAEASHSPGVLAGNSVSVPITFAPNVCGNSVDGGAALNPAMGNTCVTTTGSHTDDGYDYGRYLSPENAEAFDRYLHEREGRHRLPEQRRETPRYDTPAPRHAAPRHAAPRHEEPRDDGRYGAGEECDDHPESAPPPAPPAHHAAPAPPEPDRPHPMPEPEEEAPQPLPAPAPVEDAPQPLPAPAPERWNEPAPEAPAPLPAPAPAEEAPVTLPAPAPVEEAPVPLPAPAGDLPVHQPPAVPAPAPSAPAPARVSAPVLAETGAGQPAAAAALATALILGGAILYRRSRIA
ncbi:chaplin [Streptomyces sp. NPDC002587]